MLGGVRFECDFGLDGHSDADCLTHAICDALLGAAGFLAASLTQSNAAMLIAIFGAMVAGSLGRVSPDASGSGLNGGTAGAADAATAVRRAKELLAAKRATAGV